MASLKLLVNPYSRVVPLWYGWVAIKSLPFGETELEYQDNAAIKVHVATGTCKYIAHACTNQVD